MKYIIVLCQGISTSGEVSPQTKQLIRFVLDKGMSTQIDVGKIIVSGGYRDKNGNIEADTAKKYLRLCHAAMVDPQCVTTIFFMDSFIFERSSSFKKGGNISNLVESRKIIQAELGLGDEIISITSKPCAFRTMWAARRVFPEQKIKIIGQKMIYGNNVQFRNSNELIFWIWNFILTIATIVYLFLSPIQNEKWILKGRMQIAPAF